MAKIQFRSYDLYMPSNGAVALVDRRKVRFQGTLAEARAEARNIGAEIIRCLNSGTWIKI